MATSQIMILCPAHCSFETSPLGRVLHQHSWEMGSGETFAVKSSFCGASLVCFSKLQSWSLPKPSETSPGAAVLSCAGSNPGSLPKPCFCDVSVKQRSWSLRRGKKH